MKKLVFLVTAIFLACASLFAAEGDFSSVCATISEKKVTKGSFVQTKSIKKMKREVVSKGTFIIAAGEGIFWNTEKPFPSKTAVTSSAVIQTSASGKKSVMKAGGNQTFEEFSGILSSVFEGNHENIEKNFTVDFQQKEQGEWTATLTPKTDILKKFATDIVMTGNKSLKTLTINEKSGDFLKYEFSNQTYSDSLSENEKSLFRE